MSIPSLKRSWEAINWDVGRQQYDMMVKYATALKTSLHFLSIVARLFMRNAQVLRVDAFVSMQSDADL